MERDDEEVIFSRIPTDALSLLGDDFVVGDLFLL